MSPAQPFLLIPFTAPGGLEGLRIDGSVCRLGRQLQLHYRLQGPLEELIIPSAPAKGAPERQDGLWLHTCLEAFWAVENQPDYWELNISPAGPWNLYKLNNYREGLTPEPALAAMATSIVQRSNELQLKVAFSLPEAIGLDQVLQLSVAAVIEQQNKQISYWSLAHPGPEPDFHLRDGFLLRLT